jgi:hypothetical protein
MKVSDDTLYRYIQKSHKGRQQLEFDLWIRLVVAEIRCPRPNYRLTLSQLILPR